MTGYANFPRRTTSVRTRMMDLHQSAVHTKAITFRQSTNPIISGRFPSPDSRANFSHHRGPTGPQITRHIAPPRHGARHTSGAAHGRGDCSPEEEADLLLSLEHQDAGRGQSERVLGHVLALRAERGRGMSHGVHTRASNGWPPPGNGQHSERGLPGPGAARHTVIGHSGQIGQHRPAIASQRDLRRNLPIRITRKRG